jgi:AcrR family transcriptional regulator
MASTALRDRQMELTRDLILGALAELIGEGRLADFSVQDVAVRAGVSHRTVYRHFASREALLDGFLPWVGERSRAAGAMQFPARAEEIAPLVRQRYAAWERLAPLVVAMAKIDAATGVGTPIAAKSLRTVRSSLAEVTKDLDPELAEAVVWTIRILWSHKTWAAYHEEGGLDAAHAGAAAAWTIELLVEALREGRGPTLTEGGQQ